MGRRVSCHERVWKNAWYIGSPEYRSHAELGMTLFPQARVENTIGNSFNQIGNLYMGHAYGNSARYMGCAGLFGR